MGYPQRPQIDPRARNAIAERSQVKVSHLAETFPSQEDVNVAILDFQGKS